MLPLEISSGAVSRRNGCPDKMTMRALVTKALKNKLITRPQANAMLRHARHHTEGHLLFMLRLMIEKHMTYSDAHKAAMRQVGK